jgi:hypothetical protein
MARDTGTDWVNIAQIAAGGDADLSAEDERRLIQAVRSRDLRHVDPIVRGIERLAAAPADPRSRAARLGILAFMSVDDWGSARTGSGFRAAVALSLLLAAAASAVMFPKITAWVAHPNPLIYYLAVFAATATLFVNGSLALVMALSLILVPLHRKKWQPQVHIAQKTARAALRRLLCDVRTRQDIAEPSRVAATLQGLPPKAAAELGGEDARVLSLLR